MTKDSLNFSEKDKEVASRASRIAAANHTDDFWGNVTKEVDRLEKKPKITPRKLRA